MASMDVFKADAFSMNGLMEAVESIDYKPQFLGSLGLFQPKPQRTRDVMIESRDGLLSLIQTTPIGAPVPQLGASKATVRPFKAVRLAKGSRIYAEEIQGIREFGTESELKQVQAEVGKRLEDLTSDMELTWEAHRLGAIQGIVTDADGSPLVNYFTEFGVAQPAEVSFNFATLTAGQVRPKIEKDLTRPLIRAGKGAFATGSSIMALCGDDFWDALVNHVEIRESYLRSEAAAALREPTAFQSFNFAGVTWVNYRGTDDNSTVAIATNKAKFFPVGARGVFQVAWAPGESFEVANQPGVPMRPMLLPDVSGRNAYADVEIYSYPLYVCTRPLMLRRATLA